MHYSGSALYFMPSSYEVQFEREKRACVYIEMRTRDWSRFSASLWSFHVALYDTPAEYPFFALDMGAVYLSITEHKIQECCFDFPHTRGIFRLQNVYDSFEAQKKPLFSD